MWLIIIDFHLAFLRQPADQKKKKRKVPITMCTRSVMDGAGARVTWEIQFRRIRVLITFLELSRGRGAPPNHSMTQGMLESVVSASAAHWPYTSGKASPLAGLQLSHL